MRVQNASEALSAVRSGMRVFVHGGVATPTVLVQALVDAAPRLNDVEIMHLHTEGHDAEYAKREYAGTFKVSNSCIGRRPPGLVAALNTISDPVARFWSTVAHLEQSAVIAFRLLAKELEAFGAPAELIERAVAAAEDEVRHAIQTRAIAERMGGVWIEPEVEELEDRSLLDFAIDNATEGCVRETFGAAVGRFQACVAEDDEVRRVMKQVGEDETRHAELSWDIAVWCDSQLTEEEQAQVQRAQRLAYVDLVSACHAPIPVALARQAGYPGPQHALRLVNGMKTLWV